MVSLLLGAPPGEATESACPTGWVRISQEPDVYICPAPLPPQADIPARAQHFRTSSGAADNVIGRRRVVAYSTPKGVPRTRKRGSHGPKGVPRGVPRKNAFVMRSRKAPRPRRPMRRPRNRSRRNRLLEKLVANAALQTLAVAKVVVDSSPEFDRKRNEI